MNGIAYANFRVALQARLQQLAKGRRIPAINAIDRESFTMQVGSILHNLGRLLAHGLASMPQGIGTPAWQSQVSTHIRRSLLANPTMLEEQLIALATASAIRFALLEGSTYSGLLPPAEATAEELGWNAPEAVAFARTFCPSDAWHELAPLVVLSDDRNWSAVVETVRAAGIDEPRQMYYRELRVAYDAYVMPTRALALPGRPPVALALAAAA